MITTDTFPKHVVDAANKVNFTLDQLRTYTDKVYKRLSVSKPGSYLSVTRLAKTKTKVLFIEVVKLYHDEIGGINFNSDYSSIYKLNH